MKLTRLRYTKDGAFGYLKSDSGDQVAVTCEHTYQDSDGNWQTKIPTGVHKCVKGEHNLGNGPFETFQILVEGHTNLLFHPGNTEMDSEGCILLGTVFGNLNGLDAVLESRPAFFNFMDLVHDLDEFTLEVE